MQDSGFSIAQIEELANMLGANTEENAPEHQFGSALNPGTLHGGKDEKELAKPGVKMEVKGGNNRAVGGGAIIPEE